MATLKRIFLVFFGIVLALLLLSAAGAAFSLRPLDVTERLSVLNREQLSYDELEMHCQPIPPGTPPAGAARDGTVDVFGGSSVAGVFASPGADFSRELGRRLARRWPGRWEVRNRGVSAKNSFFVLRCLERTLGDGARTWVVYEGHNDFIDLAGPHLERSVFFLEHPLVLRGLDALLKSPASAALRPFLRVSYGSLPFKNHERQVRRILELSAAKYRAMIALARAHGIRLVLCTVISNLDYPPLEQPPAGEPDGWTAQKAFDHAKELYSRGQAAEGYRFETLARDRDPRIWRAPTAFNELMRKLARENPDVVTLVDLERALQTDFGEAPIGCNLFGQNDHCDWVHPNDMAHAWIARQLDKALFAAKD